MAGLMSSLLKNIINFIDVLRLTGVRVSISESIDVIDALRFVDVSDKYQVRTVMSACLAKSVQERMIFLEAFDRFFVEPCVKLKHVNEKVEQIEQKKTEIVKKASELRFQEEILEIEDNLTEVYASLPESEKQSILDFLDKTSTGKNVKPEFKSIVETIVEGKLKRLKPKYPGTTNGNKGILNEVISEAGIIAGNIIEAVQNNDYLFYKNIEEIRDEDIPKVIRLIKLITEKLRKNIIRRYKSSNKKARLDFKKTIRCNLSTGGVLFNLNYKKRPKRKEKILILCDVSASMYRFSGFVLQFITGMHLGISSPDSYIFSQEIEHLNVYEFMNVSNFEQQVKNSAVWKKGTDISRVLGHILYEERLTLNSSTVVIVVSDAKTLNADKAAERLKKLNLKVKRVLWLNPVPERDWIRIAGIAKFGELCTMLDCSTLERLSKSCASIKM